MQIIRSSVLNLFSIYSVLLYWKHNNSKDIFMKKIFLSSVVATLPVFALFLFSCSISSKKSDRNPSSENSELENLYLSRFQLELLHERYDYLKAVSDKKIKNQNIEYDLNLTDSVDKELAQVSEKIKSKNADYLQKSSQYKDLLAQGKISSPALGFASFNSAWRKANQVFLLHDMESYVSPKIRYYQLLETDEIRIDLHNYFSSWVKNVGPVREDSVSTGEGGTGQQQYYLQASVQCEGPYKFNGKSKSATSEEKFYWYDQINNGQSLSISVNKNSKTCTLKFKNIENQKIGAVYFKPHENSVLEQFSNKFEVCGLTQQEDLKGPEKFFFESQNPRLTCPVEVSSYRTLPIPIETFNTKVEALIGQKIPAHFWNNRTPFSQFDMSKAPKLDAIFISYLVFRNDYFGRTIAELLKWHAARGTQVYVMASKVIKTSKDTQMFLDMMTASPNIQVQEYAYATRSGLGLKDMFDQLHRTLHAKLFITYSKSQPELNKAWVGGRNIHDGFAFEQMPKSVSDDIVNYGKDDAWAFWRDYESIIYDPAFVEKMIVQFATLWNRDSESLYVRNSVLNLKSNTPVTVDLNRNVARHILTIPYNDQMNLEAFFVSMVDSAEKELMFSTPYFRLTDKLLESFRRAIARGVKIKMITRLDLKGDTIDWLLSDVNKAGVNKFLNQIEVYEYAAANEILHSKIVLVDGKMSFFGGVNLNKRSFYHDIENGILTLGTKEYKKILQVYDSYFKQARKITEKQQTAFWKQAILQIFDKEF